MLTARNDRAKARSVVQASVRFDQTWSASGTIEYVLAIMHARSLLRVVAAFGMVEIVPAV